MPKKLSEDYNNKLRQKTNKKKKENAHPKRF